MRFLVLFVLAISAAVGRLCADPPAGTIVIEAETFAVDGKTWRASGDYSHYAVPSALKHLLGSAGGQGEAHAPVTVPAAGAYRLWVRYTASSIGGPGPGARGPIRVALRQAGAEVAAATFDGQEPEPALSGPIEYRWGSLPATLAAGPAEILLTKAAPIACTGYTRKVDCFVLAADAGYRPNVTDWAPRAWMRVTLGAAHKEPVYIHCFADHFRAPWYQHFSFSKAGAEQRVAPAKGKSVYLVGGESTPWCEITPALHEDRGAILNLRAAEKYSYAEWYPHFDATIEFATRPDAAAVVRRVERRGLGAGISIVLPGVLTEKSAGQIRVDHECAAAARERAKALAMPAFGRRPARFPFFVRPSLEPRLHSPEVVAAELDLLAAIGFSGLPATLAEQGKARGFAFLEGHGQAWQMKEGLYVQPEMEKIEARIRENVAKSPAPPWFLMLMDEPTGPSLADVTTKEPYRQAFTEWLTKQGEDPGIVEDDSKIESRKSKIHYWRQRYRTAALAGYLKLETDANARLWPEVPLTTVNFSDGATYAGNFYAQGVNYFDVFESGALTLAWSEDWTNLGSTFQMCGYNVELLRAATRKRGQPIGMYVITSYGRTPLDTKLKAYTSIARDARALYSFAYGPSYAGHEPCWSDRTDLYRPLAELMREIGGAEDLLMDARRPRSPVAMLYSVSSDIWTAETTNTYGMEREHVYLALTHAQIPVDFLSEEHAAAGDLAGRHVLYLTGPNLSRPAAASIQQWVQQGGTLVLSAGAAQRDEFNEPIGPLSPIGPLPQSRRVEEFAAFRGPGRQVSLLKPRGEVVWGRERLDVLSVQEALAPAGGEALATFADGSPAVVVRRVGKGRVVHFGFLPGLSYVRKALVARDGSTVPASPLADDYRVALGEDTAPQKMTDLSYNPWEYPAGERDLIALPVRQAGVTPNVALDTPVVEAFLLEGKAGAVLPLANYTLRPLASLGVRLRVSRPVARVESVRRGPLAFTQKAGEVAFRLPLRDTDFVKVWWK